ncbi:transposase, partial [Legionella dresdenensis]
GTIHELVRSVGVGSLNKAPRAWGFDGRDIKAFDGTTLTLRDTKANNAQYPKHSNQKPGVGNPQVRLLGVFSLMTGSVIDYALEATRGKGTGEVTLLRSLLDCIKEGDIALGDALFCHFFLMHDLMEKKVDVLVPGHVQRRYDFTTGLILGENDHITEWEKPRRPKWMSKELYKQYPKTIQIR